jgi:hypothetical protein
MSGEIAVRSIASDMHLLSHDTKELVGNHNDLLANANIKADKKKAPEIIRGLRLDW